MFNSGGTVKFILLVALVLALVAAGLARVQSRAGLPFNSEEAKESDEESRKNIPDLKIPVEGGAFRLSNLHLVKESGSTKLKGEISNETGQRWHQATFELKAFDSQGNQLKGAEALTIFQVEGLEANASMPLDNGYGVWLEGISFDSVAKVEAMLIDGQLPARYKLAMKTPVAQDDLTFEDEAVKIGFDIDTDGMRFVLLKKPGSQSEIDWDKARLVDPYGQLQSLEHDDISLSHGILRRSLYKTVLPETALAGVLIPKDQFYSDDNRAARISGLLPEGADAIDYKGKSMSLVVPVNINGVRKSYNFGFTITDVEIERFHLQDERYQFLLETRPQNESDIDE